jgi:hypothetical protein
MPARIRVTLIPMLPSVELKLSPQRTALARF